jgi:hypothetical protein
MRRSRPRRTSPEELTPGGEEVQRCRGDRGADQSSTVPRLQDSLKNLSGIERGGGEGEEERMVRREESTPGAVEGKKKKD